MDASVNNLIPAVYAFLPRRDLSIWSLGSHEMKNFEFLTFTNCKLLTKPVHALLHLSISSCLLNKGIWCIDTSSFRDCNIKICQCPLLYCTYTLINSYCCNDYGTLISRVSYGYRGFPVTFWIIVTQVHPLYHNPLICIEPRVWHFDCTCSVL